MELSLTTFILETVNFLALVWILKRLFFVPVKKVIEERRAAVTKTLSDAQAIKSQAERLQAQYEKRLDDWKGEKAKAEEELGKTLAEERAKRLKQLEVSVADEREKKRAQDEGKIAEARDRQEREAMKQSLEFVSRLLSSLASPELEARLIEIALGRFHELLARIQSQSGSQSQEAETSAVKTAFSLSKDQKAAIEASMRAEKGTGLKIEFSNDKSLLAGVEVVLGSAVIRANLRDELVDFAEGKRQP